MNAYNLKWAADTPAGQAVRDTWDGLRAKWAQSELTTPNLPGLITRIQPIMATIILMTLVYAFVRYGWRYLGLRRTTVLIVLIAVAHLYGTYYTAAVSAAYAYVSEFESQAPASAIPYTMVLATMVGVLAALIYVYRLGASRTVLRTTTYTPTRPIDKILLGSKSETRVQDNHNLAPKSGKWTRPVLQGEAATPGNPSFSLSTITKGLVLLVVDGRFDRHAFVCGNYVFTCSHCLGKLTGYQVAAATDLNSHGPITADIAVSPAHRADALVFRRNDNVSSGTAKIVPFDFEAQQAGSLPLTIVFYVIVDGIATPNLSSSSRVTHLKDNCYELQVSTPPSGGASGTPIRTADGNVVGQLIGHVVGHGGIVFRAFGPEVLEALRVGKAADIVAAMGTIEIARNNEGLEPAADSKLPIDIAWATRLLRQTTSPFTLIGETPFSEGEGWVEQWDDVQDDLLATKQSRAEDRYMRLQIKTMEALDRADRPDSWANQDEDKRGLPKVVPEWMTKGNALLDGRDTANTTHIGQARFNTSIERRKDNIFRESASATTVVEGDDPWVQVQKLKLENESLRSYFTKSVPDPAPTAPEAEGQSKPPPKQGGQGKTPPKPKGPGGASDAGPTGKQKNKTVKKDMRKGKKAPAAPQISGESLTATVTDAVRSVLSQHEQKFDEANGTRRLFRGGNGNPVVNGGGTHGGFPSPSSEQAQIQYGPAHGGPGTGQQYFGPNSGHYVVRQDQSSEQYQHGQGLQGQVWHSAPHQGR